MHLYVVRISAACLLMAEPAVRSVAQRRDHLKKGRIPDSHVPSTTGASLTTAPCSKTRPEIIVSIVGSADGFRDTGRGHHPAQSGLPVPGTRFKTPRSYQRPAFMRHSR